MVMNPLLAALLMLASHASEAAGTKKVAITFDDLPVVSSSKISIDEKREITDRILAALTKRKVHAIGFVNEDKIYETGEVDAGIALLQKWLDAGMELGNHTFGHVGLFKTPVDQYEDAIVKGEVVTRWLLAQRGTQPKYFRHPFLQTGNSAEDKEHVEKFLASRGYTVAPVTIENDDYYYACVDDHLSAQDASNPRKVQASYLRHLGESIDTFETMSQELFSRQIPQIFLIHANRLNAATLDQTLNVFERRGYSFISLDEALADPVYRIAVAPSGRFGPTWLMRWARAQPKELSVYGQPDPSGWIVEQHHQLCE